MGRADELEALAEAAIEVTKSYSADTLRINRLASIVAAALRALAAVERGK